MDDASLGTVLSYFLRSVASLSNVSKSGKIELIKLAFLVKNQSVGVSTNRYCSFKLFLDEILLRRKIFFAPTARE